MVEFGRLSGIEAGFFGGLKYSADRRNYSEERSRCNKDGACSTYNVTCTDTDHALRTTLSLTDFATARVLYSNSFNKSNRVKTCSDSSGASSYSTSGDGNRNYGGFFSAEKEQDEIPNAVKHLTNSADPFVQLVNATLKEIAKDLGEYYVTSVIEIEKSDDTLGKPDREKFESGVDFAVANRLDRACAIWESLERSNPNSLNLIFNLGVCREAVADYENALNYYRKADNLSYEPNKMINRALERIRAKIQSSKRGS
jgi:tetratricopeptide (TPR) repeat protein